MEEELKRTKEFIVDVVDAGKRLDICIAEKIPELSRSLIKKYILSDEGLVLVNGTHAKPHRKLNGGDSVLVSLPAPKRTALQPSPIRLDILYEDDDLIVINKQPGIPVHPSTGHENDTIVNALLYYFGETVGLPTIGGEYRPGIVHRLDKDTSGVLLIAKNDRTHDLISREFSLRKVIKIYEAIVKGVLRSTEGVIDAPIGRNPHHRKKFSVQESGRSSVTRYTVIDSKNNTSWVRLYPKTGRTHQLRVHMAHTGHPVLGDPVYARKSVNFEYILLVAKTLRIVHPTTYREMEFRAPYPEHFIRCAKQLGYRLDNTCNSQ
jgi:23S rRNA pseudouridine1911/1915/1917 synthase